MAKLQNRAVRKMQRQRSTIPTGVDLDEFLPHLALRYAPSYWRICLGDGLLVFGGALIPLWPVSWLITFGGFTVCGAGLYIREFMEPWPGRFSLRTMLIATTLVAVVLGMIAWLDRAWIGK
jgi:hypothetical protein